MSTITISEATKVYGGKVTALHGIDLTVPDGQMLVLVGPSKYRKHKRYFSQSPD